jgi:hypothetical protein
MIADDVIRKTHFIAAMAILVSTLLPANQAFAADKAAAESLFNAGKELMDVGNYAEACLKFKESHDAELSVGAVLNLALCNEKQGKTASAWAYYREAAVLAGTLKDTGRQQGANKLAAALEGRLSRLTVDVTVKHEGLTVTRNGEQVTSLGSPLPLDPGSYEVVAAAPGFETWQSNIVVGSDGDAQTLVVPELNPGAAPADTAEPAAAETSWQTIVGWTALGVGAIGLGVGITTGAIAVGNRQTLRDHCVTMGTDGKLQCTTQSDKDLLSETETLATVSTIGVVVGSIAAVGGVVLLLIAPSDTLTVDEGDDGVALLPLIGPSGGGLWVTARF